MRLFELTIRVRLGDNAPLPQSFREWIDRADFCYEGASGISTLERVVEVQHPISEDVIDYTRRLRRYA